MGLTDGSTVSCDQLSAARQAYLAKYCHSKPSIDLCKPYLQSAPQRVLRSPFSGRRHQLAKFQRYHVTQASRCYCSKFEHLNHQIYLASNRYGQPLSSERLRLDADEQVSTSADQVSVSSLSIKMRQHEIKNNTQTPTGGKSQTHHSVPNLKMRQHHHKIETHTEKERMKVTLSVAAKSTNFIRIRNTFDVQQMIDENRERDNI